MVSSKFQEHLDVKPVKMGSSTTSLASSNADHSPLSTPSHSRPSSSSAHRRRNAPASSIHEARPAQMRFPIDLGPPSPGLSGPTPTRNNPLPPKKLHRKVSSISSFGASHRPDPASTSSSSTRNAFAGPDADFDFAGRKQAQRIEADGRAEVDRGHAPSKTPKIATGVKGRLRKLSLSTR